MIQPPLLTFNYARDTLRSRPRLSTFRRDPKFSAALLPYKCGQPDYLVKALLAWPGLQVAAQIQNSDVFAFVPNNCQSISNRCSHNSVL